MGGLRSAAQPEGLRQLYAARLEAVFLSDHSPPTPAALPLYIPSSSLQAPGKHVFQDYTQPPLSGGKVQHDPAHTSITPSCVVFIYSSVCLPTTMT